MEFRQSYEEILQDSHGMARVITEQRDEIRRLKAIILKQEIEKKLYLILATESLK